ncbi:hypothetical protein MKW94_006037 [Papaver nudicaule]|uniref:RING-type E3 ubiquitin transferase n=1 Tax=Papaver nudicaule TaxID=74823 RepID=A0AA41RMB6_PAPNU|nr:hypothetical protein [Papaver nudicaule]
MSLLHFILSYIFFFFFLQTAITCQETCLSLQCNVGEPSISFPFRIKDRHGEQCAYPGFNIVCDSLRKTVLELPSTHGLGKFYVRDISYFTKQIRLYDPQNCLPQRYLDLQSKQFDISPFEAFASHTYSFFDCPPSIRTDFTAALTLGLYTFPATCVHNLWPLYITPYSSSDPIQVSTNQFLKDYVCLLRASVLIPIPLSAAYIYTYNVATDDLYLTWTEPQKRSDKGTQVNNGNNGISQGNQEKSGKFDLKIAGIVIAVIITIIVFFVCGRRAAIRTGGCFARLCCLPEIPIPPAVY